jgi:hypothetical protein
MKTLEELRRQLALGEFEFSHHAFRRAVERNISTLEIQQAGEQAHIIEEYPDDKYTPSCLLVGFTHLRRPLHIHVSLAETDLVKIITLYEPDTSEWLDYMQRRS